MFGAWSCVQALARELARGRRPRQVGFGRLLANPKVTIYRLIEGWSDLTRRRSRAAMCWRSRTPARSIFHDAEASAGSGRDRQGQWARRVVARDVGARRQDRRLSRPGRATDLDAARPDQGLPPQTPARKQGIPPLERDRRRGQAGLGGGAQVTAIADRESDIFVIGRTCRTRISSDHPLDARSAPDDRRGSLGGGGALCLHRETRVALPAREQKRKARTARLSLRFGKVDLARPRNTRDRNLPKSVTLTLVERSTRFPPTSSRALAAVDDSRGHRRRGRLANRRLV